MRLHTVGREENDMKAHETILRSFLDYIKNESISGILDAGSGRTSLSVITDVFPDAQVDAVVYPGDVRKLISIAEIKAQHSNIEAIEKDICSDTFDKEYDIVVAHLLLGEAAKFGNAFDDMLERVFALRYKYLIMIDYLEDPAVRENDIRKMCDGNGLTVVYRAYVANEQPQVWDDFTGKHNFGYLIKR